jgi:hypothetical protein
LSIPYVQVQREGGTEHFWSLVNNSQGWMHFDSTPHTIPADTCQMTASDVEIVSAKRGELYYHFNPELYPEVMP